MRLTLKLTLGILLGVAITLLVNVMLRTRRESDLLVNDIKKDHLVLGAALRVDIVEEWRDGGRDAAFALVSRMNAARAGIDISAVDVAALSRDELAGLASPDHRVQQIGTRVVDGRVDERLLTSLPITQSCAMCTYVMMKQRCPIVVLPVAELPRLIVQYSRMIVPLPISTHVSSPLYFKSCGSFPMIEP